MKYPENILLFLLLLQIAACGPAAGTTEDTSPAPEPDWEVLVVEQGAGKVSKIAGRTGEKLAEVAVGYNPHEIAISPDGRTAYVSNFGIEDYDRTIGTPGTTISVIDIPGMSLKAELSTNRTGGNQHNKAPHGLRLRPGHDNELYVNVEVGDSMLVYDLNSGLIKRSFPLPAGAHNFVFSASGDTIFLFAGENGVFSFDAATGRQLRQFSTGSATRGLTFTPGNRQLVVSCGNEIYLLGPVDLTLYKHFPDLGVKQIIYSTTTSDGKYLLAPCPYDGVILLLNTESGAIEKRISAGKAPIYVQLAPAGNLAYIANALDDHMSVLDLTNYEVHNFAAVQKPNGFAFLPKK